MHIGNVCKEPVSCYYQTSVQTSGLFLLLLTETEFTAKWSHTCQHQPADLIPLLTGVTRSADGCAIDVPPGVTTRSAVTDDAADTTFGVAPAPATRVPAAPAGMAATPCININVTPPIVWYYICHQSLIASAESRPQNNSYVYVQPVICHSD